MMPEIILGALLLAFLIYHIMYVIEANKSRTQLMRELVKIAMAKNLTEYDTSVANDAAVDEQVQGEQDKANDYIPIENLSDDDFDALIKSQLE